MFIDPIQIQQLQSMNQVASTATGSKLAGTTNQLPFQSFLSDAMQSVESTANTLDTEAYKLATGETQDLHDITIASTKYNLAVDLFVQIRNKTLDAYQQMMNMNV